MVGIYKSVIDTWMWKLGLRPHYTFSGDICIELSVLCLCHHENNLFHETGSRDKIQIFWQNWIPLGLNTNLYWFFNHEMSLRWAVLIAVYIVVRKKHMEQMIIWTYEHMEDIKIIGDIYKTIYTLNIIFKWFCFRCNRFLLTRKPYSRAANKFYCFSADHEWSLSNLKNTMVLEQWTNRSHSEPIGNNEE